MRKQPTDGTVTSDGRIICEIDPLIRMAEDQGVQCSECGLVLAGLSIGRRPQYADGSPIPLLGYLPTVCDECREAWLASHRQQSAVS